MPLRGGVGAWGGELVVGHYAGNHAVIKRTYQEPKQLFLLRMSSKSVFLPVHDSLGDERRVGEFSSRHFLGDFLLNLEEEGFS